MATLVIPAELKDVMDRLATAAVSQIREIDDEFTAFVAPATPPVEACDAVVVYLTGFTPILSEGECALIWDAQITVRLDYCVGVSQHQENTGVVTPEEQESRSAGFYGYLWAMLAGLTDHWKRNLIPYPETVNGCRKLTWGIVQAPVEEGGWLSCAVQVNVEISPTWVETS